MAKTPKSPLVDHELIRELTKLLDETGLTEIEIEQDGQRVRVARGADRCAPRPSRAPRELPQLRRRIRAGRRSIPPSIRAW